MTAEVLGSAVQTPPWIPTDDTFGARLALIRQKMEWGNVKEAALACGLPTESWRTWERDGVLPRDLVKVAARITERTGVDYGWLLAGQRMAGVNRPTGPNNQRGDDHPAASVRKTGLTKRSTRTAYPDRVGPPDNRPSGHPKLPVLPPTVDRPVRVRRAA
jgi:hypothetical protein